MLQCVVGNSHRRIELLCGHRGLFALMPLPLLLREEEAANQQARRNRSNAPYPYAHRHRQQLRPNRHRLDLPRPHHHALGEALRRIDRPHRNHQLSLELVLLESHLQIIKLIHVDTPS